VRIVTLLTAVGLLCGSSCVVGEETAIGDLASAAAAGAVANGPVEDAESDGRAGLALPDGAWLELPTAARFYALKGSLDLWLRPEWEPDPPDRHTIFHIEENGAASHVTLFKTEGATMRFVYKASADHWLGTDVPIGDWQPRSWHRVTASWTAIGDQMAIGLAVDGGEPRWTVGGRPLDDVPASCYIGRRGGAAQFAQALIADFRLTDELLLPLPYAAGPKEKLLVEIDCSRRSDPIPPVHDCVTIWNNKEFPLPFAIDSPKHERLAESGFKMARLVACSETWLWGVDVTRNAAGEIELDFTDFDALLDMVRSAGLEPYVRIAYHMPKALSAEPDSPNWAYSAPRSYDEWSDFVRAVVHHCNVERDLGIRYWVMSVNEADIAVDRHGADWDTICRLYETSVRAGMEADPTIKVGGPAICKPLDGLGGDCLRDFVTFCRERELPLDFVCFHRYHCGHPRDFGTHINQVREIVEEANPDLGPEYFLDEWSLWERTPKADDEYGAAYIAAALHYFRRAGLTKASIVSFNDIVSARTAERDVVVQQGPFDKTATQTARFLATDVSIDGDRRSCIVAHPPRPPAYTFGRYDVDVPTDGNPRLVFATGIGAQYEGMDGVGYRIVATSDGEERVLFDHFQRQQPWEAHEVSLADLSGESVVLELRTDAGRAPTAQTVADWACWSRPRLVAGPGDDPAVVFDFTNEIGAATTGVHQAAPDLSYGPDLIARTTGLPLIKGNVVTAPYFVFLAQSRLTGDALAVDGVGPGGIDDTDTAGILTSGDETGIRALLWTFDPMGAGEREVEVRFSRVGDLLGDAGRVRVRRFLIDETHSNAYNWFVTQGQPDNDGLYNLESGRIELVEERVVELDGDAVALDMRLPDFSVSLVEIEPAG